jgi:hypothetical protein
VVLAECATGSSPPSTPRPPRATARRDSRSRPADADSRPVTILTGTYGARVLGPLLASHPRDDVELRCRAQRLLRRATSGWRASSPARTWRARWPCPKDSRCLLPDACLNEGRFLDGLTLADLPRPVEVVPTEGRLAAQALDGTSFRPACAA